MEFSKVVQRVVLLVIGIICLCIGIKSAIDSEWLSTLLLIGIAIICILFSDPSQLKNIKFGMKDGTLEAEMRSAVEEAYATIDNLRVLAVKLSEPIITEITMRKRLTQFTPMKYRQEQIKSIESSLQDLGVSEEDIKTTTEFYYDVFHDDHILKIAGAVQRDQNAPQELRSMANSYVHDTESRDQDIMGAILSSNYDQSDEVREVITDLEHFDDTKSFRRIDTWQ